MDLVALPKTELHLHLEGAVPPQTLLEFAHKYGDAEIVPDLAALKTKLQYRDFDGFIKAWVWKNGYLREYEDFRLIARTLALELAAGVRQKCR